VKIYRPYSPRQSYLFPPSPQEWLGDDHLAYFILDVVTRVVSGGMHPDHC
jgi:hypothetical protein